ncbi:hypothetical protein MKW94_002283, partial [Papaver nudicaule]|nr:hypothetical protein [Papaver nudicaule]
MEGLKETNKTLLISKGLCRIHLLFWFAEITHFISKYEGAQGKIKPCFVRWNTKVLARKIQNEGMTSLRQDLTGSFINPLDEGEQSLITPIKICQANNSGRVGEKMVRDSEIDGDRELRKANLEESRTCDGNGSSNKRPTHGNDVNKGKSSSYFEVHTTGVESLEVGGNFEESVDATSASKCSVDFNTSVTGSTSASTQERKDLSLWTASKFQKSTKLCIRTLI